MSRTAQIPSLRLTPEEKALVEDAAKDDGKSVTDWTRDTVLARATQTAKKRNSSRPPPPLVETKAPPRPRAVTKSGTYRKVDTFKKIDLPEDLMVSEDELDAVIEAAGRRIEAKGEDEDTETVAAAPAEEDLDVDGPRLLIAGYALGGVFTKM